MKTIFARASEWLGKSFLGPIRDALKKLNKKLDPWFDAAWTTQSLFGKVSIIIGGIITMLSAIASIIFAVLNFDSIVDLVKGTVQGQDFWLQKFQNVVEGYPSFQSLINAMDAQLSALGDYFTPPLTFTRILAVTGIGDAVNTILVCAVQGIGFVISLRLLFWGLGRVKISMVKPIK